MAGGRDADRGAHPSRPPDAVKADPGLAASPDTRALRCPIIAPSEDAFRATCRRFLLRNSRMSMSGSLAVGYSCHSIRPRNNKELNHAHHSLAYTHGHVIMKNLIANTNRLKKKRKKHLTAFTINVDHVNIRKSFFSVLTFFAILILLCCRG